MPMHAPPPPPVAVAAQTRAETALVRQINRVRREHGLRAVRFTFRLHRAARRHSRDMLRRDQLTHGSSDGKSLSARLSSAGARRHYGEVLAWAPRGSGSGARTIVRMWLNSASHRAVLLDGSLRRVGVGRLYGAMGRSRGHAITADFSS
ncbi:MAG: CAP domain-containing protein [Solirubrobacterales bacterium]|nr:CAP domain-containing protein [Solirubrobacterales bacterium]